MPFFRKKPVVVEAIQFTGQNLKDVYLFMGQKCEPSSGDIRYWWAHVDQVCAEGLTIYTLEDGTDGRAKHVASVGDYIIKGVKGEFYPCKPDIFTQTYESAEEK